MPPSNYLMADYGAAPNPTQQTATPIGGQLSFQPGGNPFSQDLGTAYQSAYNSALGQNQANYSNILSGYQQTLAQQTSAQQAIGSGYSQLYNQVLGGIQGIGKSQSQAIADAYAQQSGSSQQDLINRGLGNSTVLSSVQRGLQFDKQKADTGLANQIAQLNAGYQSQLGGAGLNYANQANMQNAAQQNAQLGFMNSVAANYPNGAMYNQLAQQQGAAQQANLNRQQAADQFDKQLKAAQLAKAGAGGAGSVPPSYAPAPNLGPMGGGGGGYGGPMSSVTPFAGQGMGFGGGGGFDANFGGAQGGTTPGSFYDIASRYAAQGLQAPPGGVSNGAMSLGGGAVAGAGDTYGLGTGEDYQGGGTLSDWGM